ncbi:MAG: 2-hydroxychromene-2-carboxylate isomerase [Flavobacteriaceae bacterium]
MGSIAFWYDFASTYSYLSAMRIARLCEEAGVALQWRPFLLGPVFAAQGWTTSPFNIYPAKGRHMWRDMARLAHLNGLAPIRTEGDFPQHSVLAARVALIGLDEGWGEDFTRAAFAHEFAEAGRIDDAQALGAIVGSLGRDAAAALEAAIGDANKARLRRQTEEAQAAGIFGAPTFVTGDGELFWGDDRLEQAIAWAADRPGARIR